MTRRQRFQRAASEYTFICPWRVAQKRRLERSGGGISANLLGIESTRGKVDVRNYLQAIRETRPKCRKTRAARGGGPVDLRQPVPASRTPSYRHRRASFIAERFLTNGITYNESLDLPSSLCLVPPTWTSAQPQRARAPRARWISL